MAILVLLLEVKQGSVRDDFGANSARATRPPCTASHRALNDLEFTTFPEAVSKQSASEVASGGISGGSATRTGSLHFNPIARFSPARATNSASVAAWSS